jgi:ribosomal protein L37E
MGLLLFFVIVGLTVGIGGVVLCVRSIRERPEERPSRVLADKPAEGLRCPKCNRVVYNRRLKTCGFCGAELPQEFQLTEAESKELAKQDADSEALRKIRKLKDEHEEELRRERERPKIMGW